MKKLTTILFLLFTISAAPAKANQQTSYDPIGERHIGYTWSIDETGLICIDKRGFPHITYWVDYDSGSIVYDVEVASVASPDESGESDDLHSNQTGDIGGSKTIGAAYICVRIETCDSCAATFRFTGDR